MISRYVRRVLHSSSLYPLGTFWLAAMVIVPSIVAGWVDLGQGMVSITLIAGVLVLTTDRRDTQKKRRIDLAATMDLAGRVEEVHHGIETLIDANDNIPKPNPKERGPRWWRALSRSPKP